MKSRGLKISGYIQGPESGEERGRVLPAVEAGEMGTLSWKSLRATFPVEDLGLVRFRKVSRAC